MEKRKRKIVEMLLNQNMNRKDEKELLDLLINHPITVDIDKEHDDKMTFGDKVADKISEIVGSWRFIISFSTFLVLWIIFNLFILEDAIDPYPFILLNLLLSCLATLQAPIIMMSQNRQAKKDTIRNQNDYRIDLKSELILEQLHDYFTKILEKQDRILSCFKTDGEKNEHKEEKKDGVS